MKIIVFSDSHGSPRALSRAIEKNITGLDLCVFLGDGTDDAVLALEAYPSLPRIIVSGNREEYLSSFLTFPPFPFEAEFEEQGVKFLASYAASKGADVLLYGHTHLTDDRTVEPASGSVRMIIPGSAGRGSEPSYALLTLMNGVLLCGFGETCE